MTEEIKKSNVMVKGVSFNPNGRPKGAAKPISRLRSTLNKLKQLEPDAVDVIEKALLNKNVGADVDKSQVDTAKWIITTIASLTRTAITEETFKSDMNDRSNMENLKDKATGTGKPVRFTTHIIQEED